MGRVDAAEAGQELPGAQLQVAGQLQARGVDLLDLDAELAEHDVRVEAEVRVDRAWTIAISSCCRVKPFSCGSWAPLCSGSSLENQAAGDVGQEGDVRVERGQRARARCGSRLGSGRAGRRARPGPAAAASSSSDRSSGEACVARRRRGPRRPAAPAPGRCAGPRRPRRWPRPRVAARFDSILRCKRRTGQTPLARTSCAGMPAPAGAASEAGPRQSPAFDGSAACARQRAGAGADSGRRRGLGCGPVERSPGRAGMVGERERCSARTAARASPGAAAVRIDIARASVP